MKKSIQESVQAAVQKAWSEMVTSVNGIEEEMSRRYRAIKERADFHQHSEEVQRVFADLGKRLKQKNDALEERLQESVNRVVSKFKAPLIDEIVNLKEKAEQLGHRIEAQLHCKAKKSQQPPPEESGTTASQPTDQNSAEKNASEQSPTGQNSQE